MKEIRLLVGIAATIVATNIACRLFENRHERQTSQHQGLPQSEEIDEEDEEARTREKAIREAASVIDSNRLFGTYYFLKGDLERAWSYYKNSDGR